MTQLSEQSLQALKALDTPTVCNAIEAVYPNRRNHGFTVRPFFCSRPKLPSVVGYARTARLRAMHKPSEAWDRDSYYSYIAEGGPVPSVVVIQDLDEIRATAHSGERSIATCTMDSVVWCHHQRLCSRYSRCTGQLSDAGWNGEPFPCLGAPCGLGTVRDSSWDGCRGQRFDSCRYAWCSGGSTRRNSGNC